MRNLLTRLSRRRFPYEPLIEISVSAGRLVHNLEEFQKISPKGFVAPVLKSNAYGHGLYEIAHILEDSKSAQIPFFVVDSYFEAVAVRASGIKMPLLVIGYTRPQTVVESRLKNVGFTVADLHSLRQIDKAEDRARIHLKIDTGMHRQGILPEELDEAMRILHENPYIILEGLCSHLADADNADPSFTESQIAVWNAAVNRFRPTFPSIRYFHLSNTDGHRFPAEIKANVTRLGIGLYGLSHNPDFRPGGTHPLELLPVMEMTTIVTGVKRLKVGETIGYGNTFRAEKDMTIAVVPVGYFEGVDRRLSSGPRNDPRGFFLVGPHRVACPIVGRVSMNITTIDVSAVPGIAPGAPVVVFSATAHDPNSFVNVAKSCGTISYETAVHIPEHLKRVVK